MSEIPETPTAAARSLIGWFAGGLAFQSVENLHSSYVVSSLYGAGAVIVAIVDFKLPALLSKSPQLTKTLNQVSGDARWWVGVIFITLITLALSPYIEERRWPFEWQFSAPAPAPAPGFTQQQVDEKIANAVANLNSQLTEANRQRDAAQREANAFRQQIQNAPAPPPRNLDTPRVYTEKTVATLWGPCEGRTPLQCDILIGDEKGKWINADGRVALIQPNRTVTLYVENQPLICFFEDQWKAKLDAFRNGEAMSVSGKIQAYNGATLLLGQCELHG
jgi:hypothetical protein